jgi:FtsH-binding integral membrane protein
VAVGLGCFFAARTFRGRAAWMAVFIFGLSVAAGVVLAGLAIEGAQEVAIAAAAVLLVAAVAGRGMPRWFGTLYAPLWFAAWLSVIGLIASWMALGPGTWTVPLAMITVLVFSGLAAAWFARLPPDPLPVSAMDLYLLGLNLFLTISILKGELAWP